MLQLGSNISSLRKANFFSFEVNLPQSHPTCSIRKGLLLFGKLPACLNLWLESCFWLLGFCCGIFDFKEVWSTENYYNSGLHFFLPTHFEYRPYFLGTALFVPASVGSV